MALMTGSRFLLRRCRPMVSPISFCPHDAVTGVGGDGGYEYPPRDDPRREGGGLYGRWLCARFSSTGDLYGSNDRRCQPRRRTEDAYMACSPVIAITGGQQPETEVPTCLSGNR